LEAKEKDLVETIVLLMIDEAEMSYGKGV